MTYNKHQSFVIPKGGPKVQLLSTRIYGDFLAYNRVSKCKYLQKNRTEGFQE